MINRKFKNKITPNEASILSIILQQSFETTGNTKDKTIQLALCVILKVRNRLSVNIIGCSHVNLTLNYTEALAFHILYKRGIIISNFLTIQIFTPIDRAI